MKPKVSVIVPCYLQATFLEESLMSVFHQTYDNWECIIVNDGSPDNTEEIAKNWVEKDERFKYIHQENKGVSSARNNGISCATGTLILPLDADDLISNNYLSLAVEAFSQKDIKLVYCKAERFGIHSDFWNLPSFSLESLAKQNMIFSSAVFKKIDWERVGGYDEKMSKGWEDWEFWINLLKTGGKVRQLDEIGFFYRTKSNSRNMNVNKEKEAELYNYLAVKHADFFTHYLGSFHFLYYNSLNLKTKYEIQLKSKKFLLKTLFDELFNLKREIKQ